MPPKILLIGITVLSIVIILAGVSWTLFGNNQSATPSPSSGTPTNQDTGATSEPNSQNPDANANNTTPDSSSTTPNDTSTQPSTGLSPQEQMRDTAMVYIKGNHTETAALMANLSWVGGRDESGPLDTERYIYYGGNWTVTVEYPAASESPAYTIKGTCNSANRFIQFTVTCTNNVYTITNYSNVPQSAPQT